MPLESDEPLEPALPPPPRTTFELMAAATTAAEIGKLIRTKPEEECTAAWKALPPVQRAALLMIRFFPESVITHDELL
jgi:hypothetical protein